MVLEDPRALRGQAHGVGGDDFAGVTSRPESVPSPEVSGALEPDASLGRDVDPVQLKYLCTHTAKTISLIQNIPVETDETANRRSNYSWSRALALLRPSCGYLAAEMDSTTPAQLAARIVHGCNKVWYRRTECLRAFGGD